MVGDMPFAKVGSIFCLEYWRASSYELLIFFPIEYGEKNIAIYFFTNITSTKVDLLGLRPIIITPRSFRLCKDAITCQEYKDVLAGNKADSGLGKI